MKKDIKDILIENELLDSSIEYDVIEDAQPEVQQAVQRFNSLPEDEKEDTVLLWWLLGASTNEYKMYPEVAEYTDESEVKGKACGNCRYIWRDPVDDTTICSQIKGNVKESGWCKLWKEHK